MGIEVTTNGHARELKSYAELTPEIRTKYFDYVGELTEHDDEAWNKRFFQYKDWWYDTQDIPSTAEGSWGGNKELRDLGWDGFASESYWSGIAIKYAKDWSGEPDYDAVVVAWVYWSDDVEAAS